MNRDQLQGMLNMAASITLLTGGDGGVGADLLCEVQESDLREAFTRAGLMEHPDAWAGVIAVCGMFVHDAVIPLKEAKDDDDEPLFLHIATMMAMQAGAAIAAGRMIGLHPVLPALPTTSGQVHQTPGATGDGGGPVADGAAPPRPGSPESQVQGQHP